MICTKDKKGIRNFLGFFLLIMCLLLFPILPVHAASKPAKVTGVGAAYSGQTTIIISWNKAKRASKYEVYRSDSPNGIFVKVKTTKSTSWSDPWKSGMYYYKVRAVKGKKKGAYSLVVPTYYAEVAANFPTLMSHWMGLTGVQNARDLGGYVTADNKVVKMNKLLRSGDLEYASYEDICRLYYEYHVKLVVDFRSNNDYSSEPDQIIPEATYKHIPIFENSFSTKGMKIAKTSDTYMKYVYYTQYPAYCNHYIYMCSEVLTSSYSQKQYKKMFQEILANNGDTVLIHCQAGKDRTGVASVLILAALGVDNETIIKDYGLTNCAYINAISRARRTGCLKGINEGRQLALLSKSGVSEDMMRQTLNNIVARYGSMEGYLKSAIGLTDDDIQQLRLWYTE